MPRRSCSVGRASFKRFRVGATLLARVRILAAALGGRKKILAAASGEIFGINCADRECSKKKLAKDVCSAKTGAAPTFGSSSRISVESISLKPTAMAETKMQ